MEIRPLKLSPASQRKAEATALFARGLFDQESEGPEVALESYRKVLALDPGYTGLAVHVAQEDLRRGDVARALATLKDSLRANPRSPVASIALAKIYLLNLRKPETAELYAQKALAAARSIDSYECLWDVYQFTGQRRKADQLLVKASQDDSRDPEFWLELTRLFQRQTALVSGPEEEWSARANAAADKAAELGFNQPLILNKAAEYFFLSGQLAKAAPLYERILKLDPDFPDVLEKLAGAYMGIPDYEHALPVLRKLIGENPQSLNAYDQLAQLYRSRQEDAQALEAMQKALLLAPYVYERHVAVIGLMLDLQRYETALMYANGAAEKFPQSGLLTYLRAISLCRLERAAEALPLFERALVEGSTQQGGDFLDAMFYFEYGIAAEQAKAYARAAELFKKSIELDPGNAPRTCNYLGYMWVERGENLAEAEMLIRRALKTDPENGAYIDSLGWLYFKQGKYADALIELLRAAERLSQPDTVVYEHIGDAYRQLGRNPEALLYWQKAAQLDPENKALAKKIDESAEKVASKP
ncbi:MAG TPA: tetratricopeptide repeat protein [Chthoniobacterales bacterium]